MVRRYKTGYTWRGPKGRQLSWGSGKRRTADTLEGPEATRRGVKRRKILIRHGPTHAEDPSDWEVIGSERPGEGGEESEERVADYKMSRVRPTHGPGGQRKSRRYGKGLKDGGIMKAGKEYSVEEVGDETYGIDEIPTEWGRKKLDKGTEQLIKGSEFQVRGRYFNNNNGKGTF